MNGWWWLGCVPSLVRLGLGEKIWYRAMSSTPGSFTQYCKVDLRGGDIIILRSNAIWKSFVPFGLILSPDLVLRVPKKVVLWYLNSFTYDPFLLGGL